VCAWLDHLSEAEKRAYILADNKLAELSSFDDDLLERHLPLPRGSSSVRMNRLVFVESSSRPRPISGAHEARYTNTTKEGRQHDQDQYAGGGSMNRNAKAVLVS
jgi:hypothetical protein